MKTTWAILGPGTIAHQFAQGLECINDAELSAVAEIELFYDRACSFAEKFNIPNVYKGIDALCADESIDIVYISMINTMHKAAALACMNAGKHVLCEKPMGINAEEVQEMIQCAKKKNVFLMEAFFTNFIPAIDKVKCWINDGEIGRIKSITADFGFKLPHRNTRHFNKALGGGALLDVGIYTIGLPMILMGKEPLSVEGKLFVEGEGVDVADSITMCYENAFVRIHNSLVCDIKQDMYIYGEEGYIYVPEFWHAEAAELHKNGKLHEKYHEPFESTGYNFEAQEAMKCIAEGRIESSLMPHEISLAVIRIMDDLRKKGGIIYESEYSRGDLQ